MAGMVPTTDDERLWFLQSVPALRHVDPSNLVALLPHLDEGQVPAGHVLAGDLPSSAVTVVVDGLVEVCGADGVRTVRGPGTAIGHLPGCDAPRTGEVVRAMTAVVAAFLPASRFALAREGSPHIGGECSCGERRRASR